MPLTFEQLSREVVTRFLQSVVVVDDRASLRDDDSTKPHTLLKPTRETIDVAAPATSGTDTVSDSKHELNARLLINVFAEKGLVCGVIRPKFQEPFEDKAINAALRADITVLDWQLQGTGAIDPDKDATSIITKIIEREKSQNRIRLIAVYSAENPDRIKGKIEEILGTFGEFKTDDDGYTFIQNTLRIAIFAKDGTIGADPSRTVKENELPDKLIGEFIKMTMGLLSNAVLESLAALRLNTHRILGNFPPDLDAPYLTNRALLDEPEEAEDRLTDLIAEELQDILEEINIGTVANLDTITKWLKYKEAAGKSYTLKIIKGGNTTNKVFTCEELNDLLGNGKERWKCKDEVPISKLHQLALTDMFHCNEETCKFLDEKYVFTAIMRSRYGNRKPRLTSGTVVKKQSSEGDPQYFICVQQPCDCIIRTKETKRTFMFLPLSKATDGRFQVIIKEANEYSKFVYSDKPYDLTSIEFTFPEEFRGLIESEETDGKFCFKDSKGNEYLWLGELKPQFVRRILQTVAAKLTRADVDEPEWLRYHSK